MILIQLEHCVLNDPIETTTITTTTRVSIKKVNLSFRIDDHHHCIWDSFCFIL